jgi:hypothetical protein
VWFDNEPTVYIVAAFTTDVAKHDAALRLRLGHPGRLVLQGSPHSLAEPLRHGRGEPRALTAPLTQITIVPQARPRRDTSP